MQKYLISLLLFLSFDLFSAEGDNPLPLTPLTLSQRLKQILKRRKEEPKNFDRQCAILEQANRDFKEIAEKAHFPKFVALQKELQPHAEEIFERAFAICVAPQVMDSLKVDPRVIAQDSNAVKRHLKQLLIADRIMKKRNAYFAPRALKIEFTPEPQAFLDTNAENPTLSFSSFHNPTTTPVKTAKEKKYSCSFT